MKARYGVERRRLPSQRPGNVVTVRRHLGATASVELAGPGGRDEATASVEAALWIASEPLAAKKLAYAAGLPDSVSAVRAVERLRELLDEDGSAFGVREIAGGYQLLLNSEYYPWLARLRASNGEGKLTPSQLETLAVIAGKQPLGRADLEAIRGVHCGETLRQLVELKLVQIAGRDDSLGRPVLYATTKKFLQVFGLKDLSELP